MRIPGRWPVGLAAALTLALAPPAAARAEEGQVETDRPDVTNSAKTVPAGAFQIEGGVEYARSRTGGRPAERRFSVEVTVRAGLTERLEIQVGGEPLVHLRGAGDETDVGDVTLGLKYRVLDPSGGSAWPALGLQPFVKLPTAGAPIGSERADFRVLGLASFDLPARFGLDVNAGLAAVGQSRPSGYLVQALASASLSREIAEGLTPFLELFFASRGERDGRNRLGFDTGVVYLLTRRVALDAAIETSLVGQGPDYAVRAGLTVRFGR